MLVLGQNAFKPEAPLTHAHSENTQVLGFGLRACMEKRLFGLNSFLSHVRVVDKRVRGSVCVGVYTVGVFGRFHPDRRTKLNITRTLTPAHARVHNPYMHTHTLTGALPGLVFFLP